MASDLEILAELQEGAAAALHASVLASAKRAHLQAQLTEAGQQVDKVTAEQTALRERLEAETEQHHQARIDAREKGGAAPKRDGLRALADELEDLGRDVEHLKTCAQAAEQAYMTACEDEREAKRAYFSQLQQAVCDELADIFEGRCGALLRLGLAFGSGVVACTGKPLDQMASRAFSGPRNAQAAEGRRLTLAADVLPLDGVQHVKAAVLAHLDGATDAALRQLAEPEQKK